MSKVSFFTPVVYPISKKSIKNSLLTKVDNYFYLGGKKACVIGIPKNRQAEVILLQSKTPLLETIAKIISYCTLIIPLIMLVPKTILRLTHSFKLIDHKQEQKLGKGGSKIIVNNYGFDAKTPEGRTALVEIGKVSAVYNPIETSKHISNYGFDAKTPEGRSALLEIGRTAAANDGAGISEHIANYGFDAKTPEGGAALLEIGRTAAANDGAGISEHIANYGFDAKTPGGRAALLEIGKIATHGTKEIKLNPGERPTPGTLYAIPVNISKHINKYGFDVKTPEGRAALLEIGKIAAAKDGEGTSEHIANYGFDAKTLEGTAALLEIGMIAADHWPDVKWSWETGKALPKKCHIANYGFDVKTPEGRGALVKIGKIVTQNVYDIRDDIHEYGFDAKTPEGAAALLEVFKVAIKDPWRSIYLTPDFELGVKTPEGTLPFVELGKVVLKRTNARRDIKDTRRDIKDIREKIKDPVPGELEKFSEGLDLFEVSHDMDAFAWEVRKRCSGLPIILNLLEAVKKFESKEAQMQALPLIAYINLSMTAYNNRELIRNISKWEPTFVNMLNIDDPALRFHLVDLLIGFIEKNLYGEVQGLFPAVLQALYEKKGISQKGDFLESIDQKVLEDAGFQKTLLWTVVELGQDSDLSGITVQKLLEEMKKKKSCSDLINELNKVRAILHFNGVEELEKQPEVNSALKEAIGKRYLGFTDEMPNFADDLARTFLASKKPYMIFNYAAAMRTEHKMRPYLNTFFKSVLRGTFKEERQSTEKNPHLRALKEKHPETLEAWFKGDKLQNYKISEEGLDATKEVLPLLKNAQMKGHLAEISLSVINVLNNTKGRKEAKREISSKIKTASKPEQGKLMMAYHLLKLLSPKLGEDQRKLLIDQIVKELPTHSELIDDLNSLIPNIVTLTDTDNPFEMLSAVPNDRRNDDESPFYDFDNFLNGHTRLLTLKRGDGAEMSTVGTAIVRLQFNAQGQPVMVMDGIFPTIRSQGMNLTEKNALTHFALMRATALGVDLVSSEEDDYYHLSKFRKQSAELKPSHIYPGVIKNLGGALQLGAYEIQEARWIRKNAD